jgi:hypothetical protein
VVRRSTAAFILIALLCLADAACGGDSPDKVTLTSQVQQLDGHWTTQKVVDVDCADSGNLCRSVDYLLGHQPATPCTLLTTSRPLRILVTGRLNGDEIDSALQPLCNPSRQLAAASTAVFTALSG